MKIQVVSDLHFEFGCMDENYEKMIETPADVLVLAGDIATSQTIVPLLEDIKEDCGDKVVLYVPGNHDYYGTKRADLDKKFEEIHGNGLYILTEKTIHLDGVAFIGTTGWWDGSGGHFGLTVQGALNDFTAIHDVRENGSGIWWGQKARTFIEGRLYYYRANFPDMKRVVITHHFPHKRSIHRRFTGSLLNVCFYNAWEDIIKEYQPDVWIHGHTHTGWDYNEGKTRLVCNPQGYPEEFAVPKEKARDHYDKNNLTWSAQDYEIFKTTENGHFDPKLVIEV